MIRRSSSRRRLLAPLDAFLMIVREAGEEVLSHRPYSGLVPPLLTPATSRAGRFPPHSTVTGSSKRPPASLPAGTRPH